MFKAIVAGTVGGAIGVFGIVFILAYGVVEDTIMLANKDAGSMEFIDMNGNTWKKAE